MTPGGIRSNDAVNHCKSWMDQQDTPVRTKRHSCPCDCVSDCSRETKDERTPLELIQYVVQRLGDLDIQNDTVRLHVVRNGRARSMCLRQNQYPMSASDCGS